MKLANVSRIVFLVALAIFLQACSRVNGSDSRSSNSSRSHFTDETKLQVDELEVRPEMTSHRLEIKSMRLDAGQLTFRLFTPDGELQWEQTFTAPDDYRKTFELKDTPGIWKLEIETESATGNYDIYWNASD
jgi:hypothetical protein